MCNYLISCFLNKTCWCTFVCVDFMVSCAQYTYVCLKLIMTKKQMLIDVTFIYVCF